MAKGKSNINPADKQRKLARKRELKKQKDVRKQQREVSILYKDTTKLEKEIEKYRDKEKSKQLDRNGAIKLKSLQEQLEKIRKARKERGIDTKRQKVDLEDVGFDPLNYGNKLEDLESSEDSGSEYSSLSGVSGLESDEEGSTFKKNQSLGRYDNELPPMPSEFPPFTPKELGLEILWPPLPKEPPPLFQRNFIGMNNVIPPMINQIPPTHNDQIHFFPNNYQQPQFPIFPNIHHQSMGFGYPPSNPNFPVQGYQYENVHPDYVSNPVPYNNNLQQPQLVNENLDSEPDKKQTPRDPLDINSKNNEIGANKDMKTETDENNVQKESVVMEAQPQLRNLRDELVSFVPSALLKRQKANKKKAVLDSIPKAQLPNIVSAPEIVDESHIHTPESKLTSIFSQIGKDNINNIFTIPGFPSLSKNESAKIVQKQPETEFNPIQKDDIQNEENDDYANFMKEISQIK
ncbi:hypothetical protein BB559_006175 [Furculomyces boomerangus]|uniref:Wbp11/ELF5/Saf1 N-terminal domain-containing protein n=1 Tax=Furculomyces boomerangus TaxID=61424 RepID=A0A2T9Y474_9FUNG|nr:hypothetical protein BB559_006175 [Furculomyces boomerangus]